MKKTLSILIVVATGLLATLHAQEAKERAKARTKADTPESMLTALYQSKKNAFTPSVYRKTSERFLTKSLMDLFVQDAKKHPGDAGAVDFDPLTYSQESPKLKNLVFEAKTSGETSTVLAHFENYGEKMKLTFQCAKEGGRWKVSDIQYADGESLTKLLRG